MPVDVADPRITASIGAQGGQINPMELIGNFARTQNALNQNLLFQQTFRARQAMGSLAQQAVDQQTGQMDWNRFATLISSHPETAWMAPEVLNNIASRRLTDAQTMNAELQAAEKRLGIFSGIASAAFKNPNVKDVSDLTPYVSDALAAGGFKDHSQAIQWLTNLSQLQGPEFKQHLGQMAMSTEQGQKTLSGINGSWQDNLFYNPTTGEKTGGWVSSVTGGATPPQGWQQYLGGQVGGGGGAAQSAAAAPAAPTTAPTPMRLGTMGPMQTELFTKQGEYQKGVNDEASFASKSDLLLNEMERALKGFRAGAGTEYYVGAAKLLQSFGVKDKIVDEVAGGNLANAQEFNKLALQVATGSLRAALLPGAGRLTNTEFNAFRDANPNWDLDPRAIQKLIGFQRQLNRLAQRKSQAYALAYGASVRGEQMPSGLPDITQFEPYWIGKLQKAGFIGQDTADKLTP